MDLNVEKMLEQISIDLAALRNDLKNSIDIILEELSEIRNQINNLGSK